MSRRRHATRHLSREARFSGNAFCSTQGLTETRSECCKCNRGPTCLSAIGMPMHSPRPGLSPGPPDVATHACFDETPISHGSGVRGLAATMLHSVLPCIPFRPVLRIGNSESLWHTSNGRGHNVTGGQQGISYRHKRLRTRDDDDNDDIATTAMTDDLVVPA